MRPSFINARVIAARFTSSIAFPIFRESDAADSLFRFLEMMRRPFTWMRSLRPLNRGAGAACGATQGMIAERFSLCYIPHAVNYRDGQRGQ